MTFSKVTSVPGSGVSMTTGSGGGGSWSLRISRKAGASKPAYSITLPWQALLEQKDVLLVPPGSSIVWQLLQV